MGTRSRPIVLLAFCVLTLAAYMPAWQGGLLWDDAQHLTRAELTGADGLVRIWLQPGATQQYYPVAHSAFWLLHHLWGATTTGYHIVNILLHACAAYLLWLILLRLSVPGALAGAAVFALHPVHVESVAWISELKNLLSGTFYLGAFLCYLGFDRDRDRRSYAAAFVLFALAVLSKTVTVTLPAALLVVVWWRQGCVRVRQDVRPLLPFFAVGIAAGLMTIWVERTFIGATGSDFNLSLLDRVVLAGRVVWFYAGKLLWPSGLTFIYPRWTIDASEPEQWIGVIGLFVLVASAWLARHRTRAPLAALLLFVGTLFPALGFFDVYPFRFSFVADHFQYLASIPMIAGGAGLLVTAAGRPGVRLAGVSLEGAAAALLAVVLGGLSWQQAHAYRDAETLYRTTISRNPGAWIAHNNLAALLLEGEPPPERIDEAMRHLQRALELKPDYAEARYNLGTALERQGRRDEAAAEYLKALADDPGARRAFERLAFVNHDRASARLEEGLAHESAGRLADAERAFAAAADLDPSRLLAHISLGRVLQKQSKREAAVLAYERALRLDPASFEAHNDLGVLLAQLGQMKRAVEHFRQAVQLRPDDEAARRNYAQALALTREQ